MQNALFRESRVRLSVSRRLQSGALVYAVATRFAEVSTNTNPRRAQKGYDYLSHSPTVYDAACLGARNPGLSYFPSPHIPCSRHGS